MKRHAWLLGAALALGCGGGKPANPDAGPKPQDDGGTTDTPFVRLTVDTEPTELHRISSIAMAVGPDDRIGIAYFVKVPGKELDFELRYREVKDGQVQANAETIRTVQRVYGVSLAFAANGQPAVSYLGGVYDGTSSESIFWFQSDLAVAYRAANGTWTEQVAVRRSNEAFANNSVSDSGNIVGLDPALVFNGNEALVAYRDVHNGQFPQGDWNASDAELAIGGPTSWQHQMVALGGDGADEKPAYGGHLDMVLAGGQPALVFDQALNAADAPGQNVYFQRRGSDGKTWTPPRKIQSVGNTMLGASLAYDPAVGFGIAVVDRSDNKLTYISCDGKTGTQCTAPGDWTLPDPVYQTGTGGWYPSLAFDPKTHDPSIAFHICSLEPGRNEGGCSPSDDALVIATRVEDQWREVTVDTAGGWSPKLAFLSTGQRVVLYRVPTTSVLMLAVER
ncbi:MULTISPECIES: hypothetical protein [unclassified Corallococcus]|uniref:hypothetical protein n=1 Tax=unclassified Corallococcus TaxID=2685029 RepID=UPI001A9068CC|nr:MULTISPECIES: hypothetical protein [unclassified Corallococcus]MBN9687973.1 hypothetical protein [Corallococcus sp. NCSPR001]WAS88216.1 hypothetical protein O0N60_14820 [Corallococcus sp. NCRR]